MGGRFALTTFYLFPEKVDNLYLIAPDGLVEGNWFRFATGGNLQRRLFKSVLHSFPTFLVIAKSLSKMGILNKGLLKFAKVHLQNIKERERVYNTWTSFRNLKVSPKELYTISTQYRIKTMIILGNYDRVIPIKRIEPKLIKTKFLILKKEPISHHKLFYYNFLNTAQNTTQKSIE